MTTNEDNLTLALKTLLGTSQPTPVKKVILFNGKLIEVPIYTETQEYKHLEERITTIIKEFINSVNDKPIDKGCMMNDIIDHLLYKIDDMKDNLEIYMEPLDL